MLVHTAHGVGRVVEESSIGRGRRQFRVAGEGWSVWVDAASARVAAGPPASSSTGDLIAWMDQNGQAGDSWTDSVFNALERKAAEGDQEAQEWLSAVLGPGRQARRRTAGDGPGSPGNPTMDDYWADRWGLDRQTGRPLNEGGGGGGYYPEDMQDSHGDCRHCGEPIINGEWTDGWQHTTGDYDYQGTPVIDEGADHDASPDDDEYDDNGDYINPPRQARRRAAGGGFGDEVRGMSDEEIAKFRKMYRQRKMTDSISTSHDTALWQEQKRRKAGGVVDGESTVLPWDPSPQFPAEVMPDEQTIQPGEREIDEDERLSPSDSVSWDGEALPAGPDCFAPPKESRRRQAGYPPSPDNYSQAYHDLLGQLGVKHEDADYYGSEIARDVGWDGPKTVRTLRNRFRSRYGDRPDWQNAWKAAWENRLERGRFGDTYGLSVTPDGVAHEPDDGPDEGVSGKDWLRSIRERNRQASYRRAGEGFKVEPWREEDWDDAPWGDTGSADPWEEVEPGWRQDMSAGAEVYHHTSGGYVAPLSSGEGWKAAFSNDPDDYALAGSREEAMRLVGGGGRRTAKGIRSHEFKPYADDPYTCVAEMGSGRTCNRDVEHHKNVPADVQDWLKHEEERNLWLYQMDQAGADEQGKLAVNTNGMDPAGHAYHVEVPYGPGGVLIGGEDGYRSPRRRWSPDSGYEPTGDDERRSEGVHDDDESGYNWGPEPGDPEEHPADREARRLAAFYRLTAGWSREARLAADWGRGEFRQWATGDEARQAVGLIKKLLAEGRDFEAQDWASRLGLEDEFKRIEARLAAGPATPTPAPAPAPMPQPAGGDVGVGGLWAGPDGVYSPAEQGITGRRTASDEPVGRCQNCNVPIYDRDGGDARQDSMSHLCWKCVKPHGVPMKKRAADNWDDDDPQATCPGCGAVGDKDDMVVVEEAGGGDLDYHCEDCAEGEGMDLESEYAWGPPNKQAGLSDKYVRLAAPVDHFNDPVQRFRDDPVGEIERIGNLHLSEVDEDPRMREYVALVEHDEKLRTAAWKDVRQKAMRLRREGKVQVNDVGEGRIYATVEGDHGVYDTMVVTGGNLGKGAQSISNWHCACPWGYWAFRRRFSYVGRLCSHGYAAYLELQSSRQKADPGRRGPRGTWIKRYQPGEAWGRHTGSRDDDFKRFNNPNAREEFGRHKDPWGEIGAEANEGTRVKYPPELESPHADMEYSQWRDERRLKREPGAEGDGGRHRAMIAGVIADFRNYVNSKFDGAVSSLAWNQFTRESGVDPSSWDEIAPWFDKHPRTKRSRKLDYEPEHLSPQLREVPGPGAGRTVDVEEDERTHTGPDGVAGATRNWFTDPVSVKEAMRRYYAAGKGKCKDCGGPIEDVKGLRPGLCSLCNDIAMEWEMDDEIGLNFEGRRVSTGAAMREYYAAGKHRVEDFRGPIAPGEDAGIARNPYTGDTETGRFEGDPEGSGHWDGDDRTRFAGRIDTLRSIVDNHQAQEVDGLLVDAQTANLLVQLHGKGNDKTKNTIETAPLEKVVDVAWKLTKGAARRQADRVENELVQGYGEEIEGIGQYQQFRDDAAESGDEQVVSTIDEILGDEHDHADRLQGLMGRQAGVSSDDHEHYFGIAGGSCMICGEQAGAEQPNDYLFDEMGRYRRERFKGKEGASWFGQLAAAPEPAEAKAGDHQPFNGSGHADSLELESSDAWVEEHERPGMDDVTDLGDGGLPKAAKIVDINDGDGVIKYGDDVPAKTAGAYQLPGHDEPDADDFGGEPDGDADDAPVIERFAENLPAGWGSHPSDQQGHSDLIPLPPGVQPVVDGIKQMVPSLPGTIGDVAEAGAAAARAGAPKAARRIGGGLKAGQGSGRAISDNDIAGAAQAFLRTAGRVYTPGEQKKLEEEFHPLGARNLDGLELDGTHYLA